MKKLRDFIAPKNFNEIVVGNEDYYGEAQLLENPEVLYLCREKITREMRLWLEKTFDLLSYKETESSSVFELSGSIVELKFHDTKVTLVKDGERLDQSTICGAQYLLESSNLGSIEVDLVTMKKRLLGVIKGDIDVR